MALGERSEYGRYWPAIAAGLLAIALAAPTNVAAQALERHVAPGAPPPPDEKALVPPKPVISDDDRVLAPALTGLVLIGGRGGENDDPQHAAIEDHGAGALDFAALELHLRTYLGKPLTLRLISQIQAAITDHYRARHRPFVAVAPPPQEVSRGVLRLRVIEFELGTKSVKARTAAERAAIARGIRVQPGQTLDATLLSQDLDWLAHSPFQQVAAQFAPSRSVGDTDLTLSLAPQRPIRVFADYSNSGSRDTGFDRYALGAQAALPWPIGGFVSYQLTGSPNALVVPHSILPLGDAKYAGQSLVTTAPLAPRQDLTLSLGYITSFEATTPDVSVRQRTTEASLTYRFALSNLFPALAGDVSIGTELRRQQRDTLFGGVRVAKAGFDIAQAVFSYDLNLTDGAVRQSLSLDAHISPGAADRQNQDAALALYSNQRVDHSRYAYLDIAYSVLAPLGHGLALSSSLNAQIADRPLSDTESFALGGFGAVRGYSLDDGAYDDGVVWRNELRLPGVQGSLLRMAGAAQPFVFADLGEASDLNHGPHAEASSLGLGAEAQLGPVLTGGATAAWALNTGPQTHAGSLRFLVHLGARY